jgi:hypothetical protein
MLEELQEDAEKVKEMMYETDPIILSLWRLK